MAICQLLKMKSIYSLTTLCIALSLASPLTQAADSTPAATTDKPAETTSAPKAEKPIELPDPVAVVDGTVYLDQHFLSWQPDDLSGRVGQLSRYSTFSVRRH